MKVVLNEVLEKESDPRSGAQMLHLYEQCGKGPRKTYRKHQLAGQTSPP